MSWARYGWNPCSDPINTVSITPLYEEPSSLTELVTYLLALPSFSGSEGPVNQADRTNTFVLSLPRCLKIPGCQDNHSLLLAALKVPGRQPSRCCWWPCHSTREPESTQSTGRKIQQLQAPSGNLDQKRDLNPSLVARDTYVIICFLWGLSE